ncbi:MAG: hypothetical protein NVV73_14845 [Cellvibrionaceae bacterium]|nr:hypothetical protein [Cellvibrionaceae bacterium]
MSDTELMLMVESRKKSRLVAILLNIFLPGAGYMYCGRWILGVVAFFFVILLVVVSLGFAAIGLYVVLIIDAALCVGRYNRRMTEDLIKSRVRAHRGTDVAEAGHPLGIESKPVSRINTAILYVFGALALVFLYAAASLFVEKSGTSFSALELQKYICLGRSRGESGQTKTRVDTRSAGCWQRDF